jgi:hypothetical protein
VGPRKGGGWLAAGGALLLLAVLPGIARGHWTIVSRLVPLDPARAWELSLHYQILAGQPNPDEPLRICFWLERHEGTRYAPVTGQACHPLTLKPNEWRTLVFSLDAVPWLGPPPAGQRLPPGSYRAVALVESDVSAITRFFLGAAQDRQVLPFRVE